MEAWRLGGLEAWRLGGMEAWRLGGLASSPGLSWAFLCAPGRSWALLGAPGRSPELSWVLLSAWGQFLFHFFPDTRGEFA